MAKTYLNTIKYEVKAKYEVTGIVEKPDIIGAIFGQSEGMLGADMDLKDLQQAGKIGRIEITTNKNNGKTFGEIIIPSSLDQIKTSILAATIETVEKVGPCEAKLNILSIRDTRKEKREQITDRAKQLLQKMQKFESVESSDITDTLRSNVRTEKVINYKGMSAGPEVITSEQIIVVEGRADVLKLLSYGIKNSIEMNGSNISRELINLCKQKEVIVLIDGDRGGELNAKKLASLTKVDYLAKAPDGKEVEELTQKEILLSLKKRQPIKDALNFNYKNNFQKNQNGFGRYNTNHPRHSYNRTENSFSERNKFGKNQYNPNRNPFNRNGSFQNRERFDPFKNNYRTAIKKEEQKINTETPINKPLIKKETTDLTKITQDFEKIKGTLKARFYDLQNKKIKDVNVKDVVDAIQKTRKKINTISMDGNITKRIVEIAEKKEIKNIIGLKKTNIKNDKINIVIIKK